MLQESIVTISRSATLADLQVATTRALELEGVRIYNYGAGRISTANGAVVERYWTTMDPEWLRKYMAADYQKKDRLVMAAITSISPFFFEDVFDTPPQLPEQMEMETMFPYRRGFVVPMHSPFGRFGILSAVSEACPSEWQSSRYELLARVSAIGHAAHQRAEVLATKEQVFLTEREQTVLKWSAFGKTSDEIALILGLTERTVRKHIASSMQKLGASSRVQAVSQALLHGYVKI